MNTRTLMAAIIASLGTLACPMLINSGFEAAEPTGGGHPATFGNWSGDNSEIIESFGGVDPLLGDQMLRFIDTAANGPSATGRDSDLIQLVDLSPFRTLILSGNGRINGSFWVNRIASSTDTAFTLRLRTYNGSPADFSSTVNLYSAETVVNIESDADANTWEQISASLLIPTDTDYAAFWLAAKEDVVNNATSPEFEGHFGDNTSFAVVPEPASFAVLGLGALALLRRKRKS